jgi:hypothetical protein
MKMIIILIVFSLWPLDGMSQTAIGSPQTPRQPEAEQTIAILLADHGQAPIPGFIATLVSRMGDGAAVGMMQYLGDRKTTVAEDPTSPEEIRRMLEIIRMAFSTPTIIDSAENKVPKVTLILLNYLGSLPAAKAAKTDMKSTSDFVEQMKSAFTTAK